MLQVINTPPANTPVDCKQCPDPSTCRLNVLGIGCGAKVMNVSGDAELRRRLLEMGFCNGASIEVLRRAPMRGPIEFRLRGYCLSLREEQAACVQVSRS